MRFCIVMLVSLLAGYSGFTQAQSDSSLPLSDIAIYPSRSASATALSINNSMISAQLLATVSKVNVRVSQQVKKGDVLLELDCADYRLNKDMAIARLDAAEAQILLATSQLDRARMLLGKSLTSQEQVDTRIAEEATQKAMLKQRQVELRQAVLNVDRCTIKAPFSGVVTERLVSVGQLASVGMALVKLVDTTDLELSANVSYEDALLLPQVSTFVFDFGNKQTVVTLKNLGGVIDSLSRNQEIRLTFPDEKPLPGTAGKLTWQDPRPFIPAELIVSRQSQIGVFIERNSIATFVALPEAPPGRPVPSQLPLETRIVVKGIELLQDGDLLEAN